MHLCTFSDNRFNFVTLLHFVDRSIERFSETNFTDTVNYLQGHCSQINRIKYVYQTFYNRSINLTFSVLSTKTVGHFHSFVFLGHFGRFSLIVYTCNDASNCQVTYFIPMAFFHVFCTYVNGKPRESVTVTDDNLQGLLKERGNF